MLGLPDTISLSSAAEVRFIDFSIPMHPKKKKKIPDGPAMSLASARNCSALHFVTYQMQPHISVASQQSPRRAGLRSAHLCQDSEMKPHLEMRDVMLAPYAQICEPGYEKIVR